MLLILRLLAESLLCSFREVYFSIQDNFQDLTPFKTQNILPQAVSQLFDIPPAGNRVNLSEYLSSGPADFQTSEYPSHGPSALEEVSSSGFCAETDGSMWYSQLYSHYRHTLNTSNPNAYQPSDVDSSSAMFSWISAVTPEPSTQVAGYRFPSVPRMPVRALCLPRGIC